MHLWWQKHQKGSLLHFIYQLGTVLQLFIWGSVFFITKRPQTGTFMEHATRDTVRRTRQQRVAPLTWARLVAPWARLVVPNAWARLVVPLTRARPNAYVFFKYILIN